MDDETICPRCGAPVPEDDANRIDCGPDGYDEDITYAVYPCPRCSLVHSSWDDKWYATGGGCDRDPDEEYVPRAEETLVHNATPW